MTTKEAIAALDAFRRSPYTEFMLTIAKTGEWQEVDLSHGGMVLSSHWNATVHVFYNFQRWYVDVFLGLGRASTSHASKEKACGFFEEVLEDFLER